MDNNDARILEYSIIKLNLTANKTLYIIAAYARCGNQKEFIPDVDRVFSTLKLDKLENYYIIAGDLNVKHVEWKNPNNNSRGIALMR